MSHFIMSNCTLKRFRSPKNTKWVSSWRNYGWIPINNKTIVLSNVDSHTRKVPPTLSSLRSRLSLCVSLSLPHLLVGAPTTDLKVFSFGISPDKLYPLGRERGLSSHSHYDRIVTTLPSIDRTRVTSSVFCLLRGVAFKIGFSDFIDFSLVVTLSSSFL